MKKIRRLVASILATSLIFNVVPANAMAEGYSIKRNLEGNNGILSGFKNTISLNSDTEIVLIDNDDYNLEEINSEEGSARVTYTATSGMADYDSLPGAEIPPLLVNDMVAFCMEHNRTFPDGHTYTLVGNYDSDPYIRGLIYYGYGKNATGLQGKWSLTNKQARAYTQFAIWDYLDDSFWANRNDIDYLNELRDLAKNTGVPAPKFNLSTTSPNININTAQQLQVSDIITTSSNYKGTFTFPSDDNVYSVDANGIWKKTFTIGESFKIVAKANVKGSISRNITVNYEDFTVNKFQGPSSAYQNLAVAGTKTTTGTKSISANFSGIVTTGNITVTKVDNDGNKLPGVTFGVYSNSAATDLLQSKTTDNNGNLTFTGLPINTTYYIKETNTLAGYIMDTAVKTVNLDSTAKSITVTNTRIKGQIKITKTDSEDSNKKLQGATFQILNSNSTVVDTITTGADGTATSKVLPYGVYKVKETGAPNGYLINGKIEDVSITEHNKVYGVTFGNDKIKGQIRITKMDEEETTKKLQGAVFQILDNDGNVVDTITTGADGTATSKLLPFGSYMVKETAAPSGYVPSAKEQNVVISENGKVYDVEYTNEKIKGLIKIVKTDAEDSNKKLQGAIFEILDGQDVVVETLTTDANGVATSAPLVQGTYKIRETQAPTGYLLTTEVKTVTIDTHNKTYEVGFTNNIIKGQIKVTKTDSENSSINLQGAVFQIVNNTTGAVADTITTGADGTAISKLLPYGTYTVEETKAPTGYLLTSKTETVNITENNKVYETSFTNDIIKGQIKIVKTDVEDTTKRLPGATFQIIEKATGTVIETLTTGNDGTVTSKLLPYGGYTVKEIKEPVGYLLTSKLYDVSIVEHNKEYEVIVKNDIIKGQIKVTKTDTEDSSKRLEGAIFEIVDANNNVVERVTTGQDGTVTSMMLPYGVYTVREVKPPTGYLPTTQTFSVDIKEHNKVYGVTFANDVIKGMIKVVKADEEEPTKLLQGATFEIVDANNRVVDSITTDENGEATSRLLPYGSYTVRESEAPVGYVLSDTVLSVSIIEHNKTYDLNFGNEKIRGKIKFIKVDSENINKKLEGAKFEIIDSNGRIIETLTSGQDGSVTSGLLVYGSYKVRETKAPTGYLLGDVVYDVSITEHNKVYEVTFANDVSKGEIEITKVAKEDNNKKLEGAIFEVLDSSNTVVDRIETDEDGIITSKMLPYGSYRVREVKAPFKYALNDKIEDVTINRNNEVVKVTYENELLKGFIKVIKTDFDTSELLSGVEFEIYRAEDNALIETLVTGEDGTATSNELLYGEYYVKETATKEGYIMDDTTHKIFVDEHGKTYEINVANKRIKGDLEIVKFDKETKEPLAGVEFIVTCLEGFDKDTMHATTTDENGSIVFEDLNYGKYEVVETNTIEGYVLDSTPEIIEIKRNGERITVTKYNKKIEGELHFEKVDSETLEKLSGATIKIEGKTELNSDIVIEFQSSENGDKFTLPYGKYTIYEVSAPEGYVLNQEVGEFEIKTDGEVVEYQIKNKRKQGSLKINKLSETTKMPLAGAVFGVYNEEDKLVKALETDENGIVLFENLDCGKYYFVELKAPAGYLVDLDKYEFELREDGQVVEATVYNVSLDALPDGGEDEKPNKPEANPDKLPDTGGMNLIVLGLSVVSIIAAIVLLFKKRR